MSRSKFFVGALVRKKNGMPGRFMILCLLSNNRAQICHEVGDEPPAEEAYLSDLEFDNTEGRDE